MLKNILIVALMSAAMSPAFAGKAKHKASSEAIYRSYHLFISPENYVEKQNGKWMYCTKGKGCVSEKEYGKGKLPGGEKAFRKPETNKEIGEALFKQFKQNR